MRVGEHGERNLINNEGYVVKLHRPSTLRWQLKAKVHSLTPHMVESFSWKSLGLSNHALELHEGTSFIGYIAHRLQ